jgi:CheY-like chemotaxis protein
MDDETKRRSLEPFFTTKGERGTGLGLAMVYGMVQRHSADIEIDSELGKGTTVRLVFPVPAAVTFAPPPVLATPRPEGPLDILVVDDDPTLIQSLRDILEGDGHHVTTADGGEAGILAFEAAKTRDAAFDVVITDLGMPYVDGRKVAASIKEASPGTPVILLTGWGQRLLAEHDVPPNVDRLLSKPPKLNDLRTALAELTTRR